MENKPVTNIDGSNKQDLYAAKKTTTKDPKKNNDKKQHRARKAEINIIGDSQVRGTGKLAQDEEDKDRVYCTMSMSGATTNDIAQNIESICGQMTSEDTLIVMTGTNDIKQGPNDTKINMYRHARRTIIKQAKRTKIIEVSTPYRYDKEKMNPLIDLCNKNLYELCKDEAGKAGVLENIRYLDVNEFITRKDYAKDGLHLNYIGKKKLVQEFKLSAQDFNNEPETIDLDF